MKTVFPKTRNIYIKNNNNNILGGDFNMVENILKDRADGNPMTQHYGLGQIENIK